VIISALAPVCKRVSESPNKEWNGISEMYHSYLSLHCLQWQLSLTSTICIFLVLPLSQHVS